MGKKLPTKAEKAMAVAGIIIDSHIATVKALEAFGMAGAAAGVTAAEAAAAMVCLSRVMQTPTQPEEHPLSKAVRKATEKED